MLPVYITLFQSVETKAYFLHTLKIHVNNLLWQAGIYLVLSNIVLFIILIESSFLSNY